MVDLTAEARRSAVRGERHPDAYRGWFTPAGLFLDTKRGLLAPHSRLLAKGYGDVTIAEGRAVYVRGRFLRARRLKGGPDRLVLKLRRPGAYVAAGSLGSPC